MGSGASSGAAANGIEIISPRVEMTKKGPKEVILDSAPLSDVGPGTIYYRYQTPGPSVNDPPEPDNKNVPTGYFFHPKLKDYSELGNPENEEAYKFIRVASGPRRCHNQNVYYVSGIGFNGINTEVPPALISSANQGKKKMYGHKYFEIKCENEGGEDSFNEIAALSHKDVLLRMPSGNCIKDAKRKLGHHFLCPLAIVHVITASDEELKDEQLLKDVFPIDDGSDINLTLTFTLK